jgi:hypothetical protein
MLCLEDFNLCDKDEGTVQQQVKAELAIEKTMLCWFCSTDLIKVQGHIESVRHGCQQQPSRAPTSKDSHFNHRDISNSWQAGWDVDFVTLSTEHVW